METVDLICLANSFKYRGRCFAGLRLDGNGWVRPVAATAHGELHPDHYRLTDGGVPQVLDVIRIGLQAPQPLPHQPENWLIVNKPWERIGKLDESGLADLLRSALHRGPDLFGNREGRIDARQFELWPHASSLALIAPDDLRWCVERTPYKPRSSRAQFTIGNTYYDLPITDPAWVNIFRQFECGLHALHEVGLAAHERLLLTISLGEEFEADGFCYKLVAGLVRIAQGLIPS